MWLLQLSVLTLSLIILIARSHATINDHSTVFIRCKDHRMHFQCAQWFLYCVYLQSSLYFSTNFAKLHQAFLCAERSRNSIPNCCEVQSDIVTSEDRKRKNEARILTPLIEFKRWLLSDEKKEKKTREIDGEWPRDEDTRSTFDGPVGVYEEINARGLSGHGLGPFTAYTCARLAHSIIKWSRILRHNERTRRAAAVAKLRMFLHRYQVHRDALFICINKHATTIDGWIDRPFRGSESKLQGKSVRSDQPNYIHIKQIEFG